MVPLEFFEKNGTKAFLEKILMDTRKNSDNFRKWNEKMAIKYNPEFLYNSANIFTRWIETKRINKIVGRALVYQGKKVLEVGCGAGNILEKIPLDKLFGVDISDFLLRRAKIKLKSKAYLSLGNAEEMPFRDKSFELVICTEVIEHTENPQILLENIYSILKPDGELIISIPNDRLFNFLKKLFFAFFMFQRDSSGKDSGYKNIRKIAYEWHLHEFKITAFINLLEKNFKVRRIYRIPYYFLPFRYLISCLKGYG